MSTRNAKLILREHPWRYFWKDIRTHYPHSKGVVGKSMFYGIYLGYQRIGAIGVQATTLPMKAVAKEIYGVDKITPEIREHYGREVVNNSIFRLYMNEPNLGSRILSLFVKQLFRDFYQKYEINLRGINSLTYGMNERGKERTGISYKAANWKYLDKSAGAKKTWADGRHVYKQVKPKHVWLWVYRPRHERKPPPDDLDFSLPSDDVESPTVVKGLSNALDNLKPTKYLVPSTGH